ncbi:hypothetical protein V6N12_026010 [Hibiscus sabdariffa]|uniref:Uncharacterized protein n=1 Tax=Hibiscus sabdariffa TaxID=183260 RepID=A0ABR2DQI4_9ROSI
MVVSGIVGFGSRTSSNQAIMQCYCFYSLLEALEFLSAALFLFMWDYCISIILMNPSFGVMLIGAVQPMLDCFVADFNWCAAV